VSFAPRLAPCGSNVLYASGAADISIFEASGEAADLLALQQLSTDRPVQAESPLFMALAINFDQRSLRKLLVTVARRNIDHLLGEKHFEVMRHDVTFACTSASASAVLAEINELRAPGDKPPLPECDGSKASN
jgi:hypothetical protein